MKRKGKEKEINKEEIAENWCFTCKDGGHLRICDFKKCLKSYHPSCVEKDDSLLESEWKWTCDWHICFLCGRSSCFHCYTCTTAFCRSCLPQAEFLKVKGKYGLCNECLKLALLIEENKSYDSDGEKVDFTDRDSCEGLFMEYYVIIRDNEGFNKEDIYASRGLAKMKKNLQSGSGSDYEEDEEQTSEYEDADYDKNGKRSCKIDKYERPKSLDKKHLKSIKGNFIDWCSESLFEFLSSIGKSTSDKLSQHDVTRIVNEYVKENKLFHPSKKKMIVCDARLLSLFRRRTINKYRIYDSLEVHFAENEENSEDELTNNPESNRSGSLDVCQKQRKLDVPKKEAEHPHSVFASITVENMKLVYLKRTLLHELLEQPESFEEKVIGSYVRVKSDPFDYCSSNSHQLMQVKGVKKDNTHVTNAEIVLQVSSFLKEILLCQLSDDDFSKEECEELRRKSIDGHEERPTTEELQHRAEILHKDITKHWINKELALLQKLIERANEKGWRRELFEYLEKKKKLQTSSEQERLLESVGKVISETPEVESNVDEYNEDENSDDDSPKSILQCYSNVPPERWNDSLVSGESPGHGHAPHL